VEGNSKYLRQASENSRQINEEACKNLVEGQSAMFEIKVLNDAINQRLEILQRAERIKASQVEQYRLRGESAQLGTTANPSQILLKSTA
jgi:hypothetical protein